MRTYARIAIYTAHTHARTDGRTHAPTHACMHTPTHAYCLHAGSLTHSRTRLLQLVCLLIWPGQVGGHAHVRAYTQHARTHARTHARMHAPTRARMHTCSLRRSTLHFLDFRPRFRQMSCLKRDPRTQLAWLAGTHAGTQARRHAHASTQARKHAATHVQTARGRTHARTRKRTDTCTHAPRTRVRTSHGAIRTNSDGDI
jgi:hypothetical protein